MLSLGATRYGPSPASNLTFHDTEALPECPDDKVLVQVAYAELNPVDLQKLTGKPQQNGQTVENPPLVVGHGGSGIVVAVGSSLLNTWKVGQRVAFMCNPNPPGCWATHLVVDPRLMSKVPEAVSLQQAATVPLAGCTAYESLTRLGLPPLAPLADKKDKTADNQTLLIVGGAGGVGSWATLLARASYPNLNIVSTVSSPASQNDWCCSQLGASRTIAHEEIGRVLPGGPQGSVDYVLCLTEPTSELWDQLTSVICPYGTICLVVAGKSIHSLDLSFCFFKGVTVTTETVFGSIRTQYRQFQPSLEIASILNGLAQGQIPKVPLSPCLDGLPGASNWKNALEPGGILEILASGHCRGKLVMKIGPSNME